VAQPFNYSIGNQPSFAENLSYMQALQGQKAQQAAQIEANRKAKIANDQTQRQVDALDAFSKIETPALADWQNLGVQLGGDKVEQLGKAFQQRTDAQNANSIKFGGQFMSALQGSPQYAVQMLDTRIDALSETDPQTAGFYRNLRSVLADEQGNVSKEGAEQVRIMAGTMLASVPGSENMFNALNTREDVLKKRLMTPEEVQKAKNDAAKAKADATVAANTANYAELTSVANLAEKGLDVSAQLDDPTMQEAVRKLATLKRREAEAKSSLELRDLQLKVYTQEKSINDLAAERANEINTLGSKISTTIDQVNKIKTLGAVGDTFGTVLQQATGPIGSRLITLDEDVSNFEEALEVLNSQVFLNNVDQMRGLGTLTDAEGQRLSNASGSLSLRQGPEQFEKELNQIIKLLELADKRRLEKYPDAVPVPDPVVLGQDVRIVDVPGIGPVTIQQVK
jgi:hypothetical protein